MNYLVKCNKCKWVHFEYEIVPETIADYPPKIPTKCFKCGNTYKDFSPALPEDVPNGSTIQSIRKKGLI
jgi:hypothetical protein